MRVILLHNPGAGRGPSPDEERDRLLAAFRRAGHEVAYRRAEEAELAEVLREPGDVVAVAGGDGTVAEVAQHLAGRGVPVGLLPLGTANNVARTLGVAAPSEQLIAQWSLSRRRPFDVGVVRGSGGTRRFLETAGIGLFAQVMASDEVHGEPRRFRSAREKLHRDLALIQAALSTCSARDCEVCLDGQDLSGRYLLLEAMNIRLIGPNVPLAPHADPGDGKLDVVLLPEEKRSMLAAYLDARLNGREEALALPVHRGRRLQVSWKDAPAHVDGMTWRPEEIHASSAPSGTLEISVEPRALELLVPEAA